MREHHGDDVDRLVVDQSDSDHHHNVQLLKYRYDKGAYNSKGRRHRPEAGARPLPVSSAGNHPYLAISILINSIESI